MLLIGNGRVCTRDEAAPRLEYGEYLNFTQVLSDIKRGETPDLGTDAAVIGGGDPAYALAQKGSLCADCSRCDPGCGLVDGALALIPSRYGGLCPSA